MLCIWIANVEYTWCHSPKVIVLVEILVAIAVSICLPSSILYWIVSIVYFTPVIFCLNAIFVSPNLHTITLRLMESNHLWCKMIGLIACRCLRKLDKVVGKVRAAPTILLCRIAIAALDRNCSNTGVVPRSIQWPPQFRNPNWLMHPAVTQLFCEKVFIAFEEILLDENYVSLLQQLQSITSRIALEDQSLQQLGLSLTLFTNSLDHKRSIDIIHQIELKLHAAPAVVPLPPTYFFSESAWKSPLDHAIKTAIRCSIKKSKMSKLAFVQALLQHYGIKALHTPHSALEYALQWNAPIAKYLILNSNLRTWLPYGQRYSVNISKGTDPYWFHCCLSPTDIEELYDCQVDVRYLIRFSIHTYSEMRDGGEVLQRKFINDKQMIALAQTQLRQFPAEIVSLLMSYVLLR